MRAARDDPGPPARVLRRLRDVEPLNVADYEALAAERLDPGAYGYYAGGAGDEVTLRDNVEAYSRWQLRPRVLVDVAELSTATTVLGTEISMPLLVAPVAFQRVAHPDGEVGMARAAAAPEPSSASRRSPTSSAAEIAATGAQRWFQLYVFRDEGVTRHLVESAREHGFSALVLTVDTPVVGRRERDFRTGFTIPPSVTIVALGRGGVTPLEAFGLMSPSVSWRDVEALAEASRLPVIVKGVLTAEDARLACEHGAAGDRRLESRRPAARRRGGDDRRAAGGGGGGRRAAGGAGRRRHPPRRATSSRRWRSARGPCSRAGRRCGDSSPTARRAHGSVLELLRAEIGLALQLVGARTPQDVVRAHVGRRPPV